MHRLSVVRLFIRETVGGGWFNLRVAQCSAVLAEPLGIESWVPSLFQAWGLVGLSVAGASTQSMASAWFALTVVGDFKA